MITASLEYKIEETKDSYNILKIKKNDKWIYVGSKYNMEDSIEKFMKEVRIEDSEKEKNFLIFGFGTGEHIKELRKRYRDNVIIVFEPNENLGDYIADLQWIIDDKKIQVICCDEPALKDFFDEKIKAYYIHTLKVGYFANYNAIYETEFINFTNTVRNKLISMQININTRNSYDKRWFETLIKNLPYIVNGTPAELYRDMYKDKPAVIVSAGPSLDKNIDILKDYMDKMVLITGGRTLKPLMERKIQPALLGAIDPSLESFKILESSIKDCKAPLLFYDGTNENIVEAHKGEKIFFGNRLLIDKIAEDKITNYCWGGSVVHALTVFSIVLGCNPIIFIGQDLAYTNEKYYAESSKHETIRDIINKEGMYVEAVGGGTVRTDSVLNTFRLSLEETIEVAPDRVFINATEGGARIKGTVEMSLSQALEVYAANEKIGPMEKKKYNVNMKKNAINVLNDTSKSIEIILKKCNKALEHLRKLDVYYNKKNYEKVNEILKKLNNIDKIIKRNYENADITESLIYPIIYDTMTTYLDLNEVTEEERIKEILYNNNKFYNLLIERLEYANIYLDDALDKIKNS